LLAGAAAIFAAAVSHPAAEGQGRATAKHAAGGHAAAKHPVVGRPAAKKPAAAVAFPGARCRAAYLRTSPRLAGVAVDAASTNTSGTFTPPFQQPLTGLPSFCDVTITQADPAGNPIHIDAWLPTSWNGRFQGVGGAVYACGPFYYEMASAIEAGYAAAATDCGVSPADSQTASWALNNGRLDWPLIHDFAYAGIHDMTAVGKAVTGVYCPSPLRFSYFNGCSTGGREGLMEAQRYPAVAVALLNGPTVVGPQMTRPLRSARITGPQRYYETVRPRAPRRYSAPCGDGRLGISLSPPA
jgi:Tannase and feruloyl esterase